MNESLSEIELPKPKSIGRLSNNVLLFGPPVPAIDRLKLFSSDVYEDFVREWAIGFLVKKGFYNKCTKCSGGGDKGRDIIAYAEKFWDNFQCKHYEHPLAPTDIYIELGKLAYYSHIGLYTLPRKYLFVSPKGVGPKLNLLFEDPVKLKQELIVNWEKYCQNDITKAAEVSLTKDLLSHIHTIDFSIFSGYDPQQMIDEYQQTPYYPSRFGGGLMKQREYVVKAPVEIQDNELVYTGQLFKAYSQHLNAVVNKTDDILSNEEIIEHFRRQRVGFYSADSLSQFSRDIDTDDVNYFNDLKDEFYDAVIDVVNSAHQNGYEKVKATTNFAKTVAFNVNPLSGNLTVNDRVGVCHHLVNERKFKWVEEA